jgi:hypothetical protein
MPGYYNVDNNHILQIWMIFTIIFNISTEINVENDACEYKLNKSNFFSSLIFRIYLIIHSIQIFHQVIITFN